MGRRDNGNENRHDKGGWKQKQMGGKEKEYEKYRESLSAIIINPSKYIEIYTYKKHINFDLLNFSMSVILGLSTWLQRKLSKVCK